MIQLCGSSMSSSSRKRFELRELKNGAHLNFWYGNGDRLSFVLKTSIINTRRKDVTISRLVFRFLAL